MMGRVVVIVFGVVFTFTAGFDFHRAECSALGRGVVCFRNASQQSPVSKVIEYRVLRLLKIAQRNVTYANELRRSELNNSSAIERVDRTNSFDFGFRRAAAKRHERCDLNRTQFRETVNETRHLVFEQAPTRIANFTTSGAQSLLVDYFSCMESTPFDRNGRMLLN